MIWLWVIELSRWTTHTYLAAPQSWEPQALQRVPPRPSATASGHALARTSARIEAVASPELVYNKNREELFFVLFHVDWVDKAAERVPGAENTFEFAGTFFRTNQTKNPGGTRSIFR